MEAKKHTLLDSLEKVPFTLPNDTYFDNLHKQLLLETKPKLVKSMLNQWHVRLISMAIAASFVVWVGLQSFDKQHKKVDFSSIQKQEIIHYLKDEVKNMDEEFISAHVSEQVVSTMEQKHSGVLKTAVFQNELTKSTNDFSLDEIDQSTLLDYLDEESLLLEEL